LRANRFRGCGVRRGHWLSPSLQGYGLMLDFCTFKMSLRVMLWFMFMSLVGALVDGAFVFPRVPVA
jgi:hypothetical protein